MEECWDHDAEARLSASCVMERITWQCRQFNNTSISPFVSSIPPSHMINFPATKGIVQKTNPNWD